MSEVGDASWYSSSPSSKTSRSAARARACCSLRSSAGSLTGRSRGSSEGHSRQVGAHLLLRLRVDLDHRSGGTVPAELVGVHEGARRQPVAETGLEQDALEG